MRQRPLCHAIVALNFLVAAAAQSPCPPQGLTLATHGGRLGDAWSIDMVGTPSALGVVGFDLAAGPVVTPIGTICLGLSPQLVTLLFTFDPAGHAAVGSVMPVIPSLVGLTVHTAAVAFDATQPNGFAISNGAALSPHQPRLYFINPGTSSPFGTTPGSFAALNGVTDDVAFTQPLATNVRDATFVRERGWLVVLLGNGALAGFDGTTGAPVLNVALSGPAASAAQLVSPPGGDQLLLMTTGTPPNPFGGGTPGALHIVSLPTGAVASTIPLVSGNPVAMILVPGTNLVFLRLATGVLAIDYANAVAFPAVPLPTGFGSLVDWQIAGSTLYCLHAGVAPGPFGGSRLPAALSAVDVNTQIALFTNPLTMQVPVALLRAGPGTTGPSLYVYGVAAASLEEFAQGTGTPTGSVIVGAGI